MDRFPRICIFCRKAVGSTYSGRTRHRNYCKQKQLISTLPNGAVGMSRSYTPYNGESNGDRTGWQDIDNDRNWADTVGDVVGNTGSCMGELDVDDRSTEIQEHVEDCINPARDSVDEWDDNVLDTVNESPDPVETAIVHLQSERLSTASTMREVTFEEITGTQAGRSVPG